jgi:hypothetical protein
MDADVFIRQDKLFTRIFKTFEKLDLYRF